MTDSPWATLRAPLPPAADERPSQVWMKSRAGGRCCRVTLAPPSTPPPSTNSSAATPAASATPPSPARSLLPPPLSTLSCSPLLPLPSEHLQLHIDPRPTPGGSISALASLGGAADRGPGVADLQVQADLLAGDPLQRTEHGGARLRGHPADQRDVPGVSP